MNDAPTWTDIMRLMDEAERQGRMREFLHGCPPHLAMVLAGTWHAVRVANEINRRAGI